MLGELAGARDSTVPMPVLACTGASIENDDVCIGLYSCLYWSVFDCIGLVFGECICVSIGTY